MPLLLVKVAAEARDFSHVFLFLFPVCSFCDRTRSAFIEMFVQAGWMQKQSKAGRRTIGKRKEGKRCVRSPLKVA